MSELLAGYSNYANTQMILAERATAFAGIAPVSTDTPTITVSDTGITWTVTLPFPPTI